MYSLIKRTRICIRIKTDFGASFLTGLGATYKDGLAVIIFGGGGAGPYFFGFTEFLVDFLTNGFPIFVCLGLRGATGA